MSSLATAAPAQAAHCFVVPALAGPITGGTLYNRELLAALRGLVRARALELAAPELGAELCAARSVWVDSLYLSALPELRRQTPGRLGLILHYAPSFVRLGRAASRSELSQDERAALGAADAFLVPSAFMRDALEALVAPNEQPIIVAPPGTCAVLAPAPPEAHPELRVVMVGNVVEGKGFEPWLHALDAELATTDRLLLTIIGSLGAEAAYAARCQRLVRESPSLAARVTFLGALPHAETLSWLARSDLFVSASRMESYGIALSEARVVGVPILARTAGNTAEHVAQTAGGQLVLTDSELARACVALARDPVVRRERQLRARASAPRGRSWLETATLLSVQLAEWEK